MTASPAFLSFLILGIPILCCGCTVGPNFVRPEAPAVKQYLPGEETAQRLEPGARVPEKWWRLLQPTKLDPIVAEALARNHTLQAALANLRQSQQALQAGQGVFYPQVNAGLGVTRQKSNPSSFGVNVNPSIFNVFTLSSTISYALDVFGGQRRAVEGLHAQEDLSRYTVSAAYLTLTGNLVNAMIARIAYVAEIEALQDVLHSQRDQVALAEANFKGGTSPYVNVLTLRGQLAATQATLAPLLQKLSQTNHLIAVLSGKSPAEWTPPELSLDDLKLPDRLPKTLPSELVRQRPDILQAEARLHSASAEIGVATAALFPSLTLSGTFGANNDWKNFWNLGAGITAPIFRGGTLSAQKQAAVEAFQAALATYRETVLEAMQQVADTLRALEHDALLVQAQSDALASANEALRIVLANYRAGTTGYVQLLTANSQYLQARIGFLQATAQRFQDTVALFVALGGGWEPAQKSG